MAGGAQDEPGAERVPAAAAREHRVGRRSPARARPRCLLPGSAGLSRDQRAGRALGLRGALCSALPLLAGCRAEGGPSYPDVRSPGLSGGGGEEAARAAITWETAPSCHQPSVLLLSGGVPGRGGKGAVPPGGAWEPQVGAAGAAGTQLLKHTHQRPHSRASHPPHTYGRTQARPQGHEGARNPDASKVLRGSPNPPSACKQDEI